MLIVALLVTRASLALPADGSSLESLVGKYPWEPADRDQPNFFEVPSIKAALSQLSPTFVRHAVLHELTTGTPNKLIDGYLVVSGCKPHNCPAKNYIILANLEDTTVTLVFYDASSGTDNLSRAHCFSMNDCPVFRRISRKVVMEADIPTLYLVDKLYRGNMWIDAVKCNSGMSLERTKKSRTVPTPKWEFNVR
jgi:hypothetical protein